MNSKLLAGSVIRIIRVKRLLLAAILGLFLGIVFARISGASKIGDMFAFFSIIGFVGFSIVLHVVYRVGFWFCLAFAIEWALLPVVTGIVAGQYRGSGFPGIGGAIGQGILLSISIPIGIIGFILFLVLAFVKFGKQSTEKVGEPDITEQIKKLAELRDEGTLTQEEFESKKSDLLSRM